MLLISMRLALKSAPLMKADAVQIILIICYLALLANEVLKFFLLMNMRENTKLNAKTLCFN